MKDKSIKIHFGEDSLVRFMDRGIKDSLWCGPLFSALRKLIISDVEDKDTFRFACGVVFVFLLC